MKICKYPNCNNLVFSHNFCQNHQWCRPDFFKVKKKPRAFSVKRQKLNDEYVDICKNIDTEMQNKDMYKCFFCDKPILFTADHHHLCGKSTSELLLNKDNLVLCHRQCHRKYHDMPPSEVIHQLYFLKMLNQIKKVNEHKYNWWLNKLNDQFDSLVHE